MGNPSSVQTDLVANDKVTEATKKAINGLQQYAQQAKSTLGGIAERFLSLKGAAAAGLGYLSGESANKLLATAKAAQILGTSVSQMQALVVAAKKGPEELTPALSRMMMVLGRARIGDANAIAALQGAGVNAQTLGRGSSQEALNEIIKGLGSIPDAAQRAARSMQIFGEEGYRSVAPLLAGGPNAIGNAMQKIKDLGIGYKQEDVDRLKKAKEAVADMKLAGEKFGQVVATTLAPAFTQMIKDATKLVSILNGIKDPFDKKRGPQGGFWDIGSSGEGGRIAAVLAAWKLTGPIGGMAALAHGVYRTAAEPFETAAENRERLTNTPNQMGKYKENQAALAQQRANSQREAINQWWAQKAAAQQAREAERRAMNPEEASQWREALGIKPEPWAKFRQTIQDLQYAYRRGAMSAGEFAAAVRQAKADLDISYSKTEQYRNALDELIAKWKEGRVTADALRESLKQMAESAFGPLLTEALGSKLKERFAEIDRQFKEGFGRFKMYDQNEHAAAVKERETRRTAATNEVGGLSKSWREQDQDYQRRIGFARSAGRGIEADRLQRERDDQLRQRIKDQAERSTGVSGPFADLMTNSEKLTAALASIKQQYMAGAFGGLGSAGAVQIASRMNQRALEQFGVQPQQFRSQFEGLQDTWKRIQASKLSTAADPQTQAKELLAANLPALKAAGVNTEKLLDEMLKFLKGNDRNPMGAARAG